VEPNDAIAPKEGQLDGAGDAKGKDGGDGQSRVGRDPAHRRKNSWHLHKKIRKIARLEVSDAFEHQGTVILLMVATLVFSLIGFWVGMRWIWRAMVG
jgi:hypothetical protein